MNTENSPASMGITLRMALMSWLVTIATVLVFFIAIIPMQKRTFQENLESKARALAVSLHNVAAGAAVNEDFSSVVDHCKEMLDGDPALDYLVLAKNDGFLIINTRTNWHSETGASKEWLPGKRETISGIGVVPLLNRRVFYYSQPFDYSGIQWGWIHVGLSLDAYDESVAMVYQRTGVLAVVCIVISLLASVFYAKHLVRPILSLRQVVRHVASGNLDAWAPVDRGDELGSLASSINTMTESLRRRDLILESMRFAAQKFLSTSSWETVVMEVLAKVGKVAAISRIHILEKQMDANGKAKVKQVCEWESPACPKFVGDAGQNTFALLDMEFDALIPLIKQGHTSSRQATGLPARAKQILAARRVKSFLLLPIVVEGSWWGILCLTDCTCERIWSDGEWDSFQAVADMFGAAIERQNTQDALVKAKESAEAASQAKSQFLANMSHEIRTPITGVIGMLQLLQRTELDKRQGRYASNALTSAETLLTVIGNVLDVSKIEAGKMELEERPFNPAEVVNTVVRLFAARAEGRGIEMAFRIGDGVPGQLLGDSNRLRQVLVNLIGNAVKFTIAGEVVVICQPLESSDKAATLRFEVRDTGCGITLEKQCLIFEPFSQADSSMTRSHGGTGLGLTISRQLCELMGGVIGVQSTPGKGSSFWFTVRFKKIPEEPAGAAARLLDLRNLRVLVVDDCATTREICRELIASWKGQVDDAADAALGLQKLRGAVRNGQPFHVAVLDWKMPGLDGFALARLVKEDNELKQTGLVLLSSFTQQGGLEEITAAGFAASIPKPASKSDLYDAIVTAANGEFKKTDSSTPKLDATPPPVPGLVFGTVLLAEDNEINREFAVEMLSDLGCQYQWVRNGREAIEVCRKCQIDLILMDCQMPEMDGYEATRAIRLEEGRRADRRHIPIVALTAHAIKGDRDRCLEAGMDDYLSKPLDPNVLVETLVKWMPKKPVVKDVSAGAAKSGPIDYPSLLRRCRGKQDLAERLVRKLVEQAGQDVQAIATAVQQNNAAAVVASAHRLKGASANVSAEGLRQMAAALETMGHSENLTSAGAVVEQLQQELARLRAAGEQIVTGLPAPRQS